MSNLENIQFVDQAQLKQVMLANADKADRRYIKKSELDVSSVVTADSLGALASKDDVGAEDLDAALAATIEAKADAADVYTAAQAEAAISEAIGGLGDLASLDEVAEDDLSDAVKDKINNVYTKTEVYTKEEAYSKDEVDAAIAAQVSSVYKPAGSATVATLPEPAEGNLGYVFNISEDGESTEDFVEGAGVKIPAGTNVVVVYSNEEYKYDVFAGELDLSGYVKEEDIQVATSAQIQDIIDSIFRGEDLNPDPEVVDVVLSSNSSLAEIGRAFNDPAVEEVNAKLSEDITVPTRSDGKISVTVIPAGKTVNLDLNGKTINADAYAVYNSGGTVNLTGEGTIVTRNLNTYGAVYSNGGEVNIGPGITIDTTQAEVPEGGHNWMYGLVSAADGVFNVEGEIITDEASTMSICNGTASGQGAQFIVSGNAHLQTLRCGAVYLADNKDLIVQDNARIDGGIVARMGNIVIKDNAQVNNDLEYQDDFGEYLTLSGVAACAPAILGLVGCYQSAGTDNNDFDLTIQDNATVSSSLGEAIAIDRLDTLYDQKVTVTVENSENLTAADGFNKIKVYEYEELAEIAAASGKTLRARTVESDVTITVDGEVIYPEPTPNPEPEPEPTPEEPENSEP